MRQAVKKELCILRPEIQFDAIVIIFVTMNIKEKY